MTDPVATTQQLCEDIALGAYVDGELDESAKGAVEEHLQLCSECRAGLRAHQYFLRELDSALSHNLNVPVPRNFSRVVTARATSDMAGLRSAAEHRKAFFFCIVMASGAFLLLGSSTRHLILAVVERIFSKIAGLIDVVWHALYDVVTSVVIISRVISRKFVIESGSLNLLLILLAFAIILLSRLISNYHRTSAAD